ncbi:MAG: cytochrome C-554 [Nitrospinae bacterium CG11_big_fil_rev_8_21_14_0_20_56_8]|nr:MAG: cytochrome C-554 [Nitrospinae bacterium CG11_big_fil_rev_8_21_14_0_20_56_8]
MVKALRLLSLVLISVVMILGGAGDADAKKKKIPKKPKFVGAVKCNGSCHDPYYQAWKDSPHGHTYTLLKPGERVEAKKRVKLDPEKDYTTNPLCLRCHTTGYGQKGGFQPAGTTNKKGKDISSPIDPKEPNLEQVGCEMCHSVAGGGQFRVVMKNTKGDFKKSDTEKYGQRWDYSNVCTRCHTHRNTPFQPTVHDKYKFNFEERKAKVHQIEKYFTEDNQDQKLEKKEDRAKEEGQTQKTPLRIEDFEIVEGKIKFKEDTLPYKYDKKKKDGVFFYKK